MCIKYFGKTVLKVLNFQLIVKLTGCSFPELGTL